MTNYENIRNMTINEMALQRIYSFQEYAGAPIQWGGDFEEWQENKKEALKLEIKWLRKECK